MLLSERILVLDSTSRSFSGVLSKQLTWISLAEKGITPEHAIVYQNVLLTALPSTLGKGTPQIMMEYLYV